MSDTPQPQPSRRSCVQWIVEQARPGHAPEVVLKSMTRLGLAADEPWRMEAWRPRSQKVATNWKNRRSGLRACRPPCRCPSRRLQDGRRCTWMPATAGCTCAHRAGQCRACGVRQSAERCRMRGADRRSPPAHGALAPRWPPRPVAKRSTPTAPATACSSARAESPLIRRIEERLARLLNWPVENGEGLQILHYSPGRRVQAALRLLSTRPSRALPPS